jgi:hypothetical protein
MSDANDSTRNPDPLPAEGASHDPDTRESPNANTTAEHLKEYLEAEREQAERLERYERSRSTDTTRERPGRGR